MSRTKNATDDFVRINNEKKLLAAADEALVTRVARGDSAALEVLYDRYAATVLGICLKVIGEQSLAEDILQETFWRVWQSAATYQAERGTFTGWLFRIARNLAIDAYRRRNVRPQAMPAMEEGDPVLDQMSDPSADVVEQVQSNRQNRQVRILLSSLPRVQRQVIELA